MSCNLARIRFRLIRATHPWLPLMVRAGRLAITSHSQHRDQIRVWRLLVQIDFASLVAMAIELSQPEFWV